MKISRKCVKCGNTTMKVLKYTIENNILELKCVCTKCNSRVNLIYKMKFITAIYTNGKQEKLKMVVEKI